MQYISTRGQADPTDFFGALMTGLAPDGGLYVPDEWPQLPADLLRRLRSMPYSQAAWEVMRPFIHGGSTGDAGDRGITDATLHTLLDEAYRSFVHHSVAPLFQTGPDEWLLELYHGPTLAFKDVAMQVLGRLYEHVLAYHDRRITLIGATSGDTGSAAIEAVRRSTRSSIFVMHPHGRTTEVQRRQMTTVLAPNVHNIAVQGTFDDCQRILKELFNDAEFRDEVALSGVNSINWARVLPQVVYYATAASSLGAPDVEVSFSVPTGNFGDIFAGYVARQMGVPIRRLIIATNDNDILARFLATGRHELADVTPTVSPSMDIQVSSNFERLLFDIHGRDAARVRDDMDALARDGVFTVDPGRLEQVRELFGAHRATEAQTLAAITAVFDETGFQIDPHTAVGVHAARTDRAQRPDPGTPMVVLGPAHPAKFPAAVERATGVRPALPPHLSDLYDREERVAVLPADAAAVRAHVRAKLAAAS